MSIREIVSFSVHPHVERGAVARAAKEAERFLDTLPGYRGRELYFDEGHDVYVDIVTWDDMDAAVAGAEKAMQSADCAAFFGMIVGESVKMLHAERVALG
ncbi:MAG: hypothetical protein U0183_25355 [Polyangiaceae bacterium]